MKSSALLAAVFLLSLFGAAHFACVSNSSVVVYAGNGLGGIGKCKGLDLNACVNSTELCPSGIRACCNYQNCTSELLDRTSCQDVDNSSGLLIQIAEGSRLTLTRTYVFNELSSVVIQGLGEDVAVECLDNVSVIFEKVVSVVIQNIKWINCGGSGFDLLDDVELSGALLLIKSSQVRVINSHFVQSVGAGVVVKTSIFEETENRVYYYYFENSTFSVTSDRSPPSHAGGGISIHLLQYISQTSSVKYRTTASIQFKNCNFSQNSALSGGGVFIRAFSVDQSMAELGIEVEFQTCTFVNNSVLATGGAVAIVSDELADSFAFFDNCYFLDNEALVSGGAVHLGIHNEVGSVYSDFSNCHWESNKALESSALSVISPKPKLFIKNITVTNSTVVYNNAQLENYDAHCTTSFSGISELVMRNVNISDNIGSGVCLYRSLLVVDGNVWIFFNHRAHSGGGISLHHDSYISLTEGSFLSLESNTAVYGGALFVDQPINGGCVLNSTEQCANVTLTNNQAFFNGGTFYVESPVESCRTELKNLCMEHIQYADINSAVVGDVNFTLSNGTMTVFPGQQVQLDVSMKDFFGNSGKANIRVYLHPHNSKYYLVGSTQFTLQDGVNRPNLTLLGLPPPDVIADYYLVIAALDEQSSNVSEKIYLSITQCPLGYEYNSSRESCVCTKGVVCNNFTGTPCILKGYWFGNFPDNSSPPLLLSCSSGYCSNIGNCTACTAEGDYCVLSDSQCIQSRVGPMCLECPEGSSYTFGAIGCADDKFCQYPGLLTSLFIVIYCILSFVLLFLTMKFTNGTTLGSLFCFVYYFSVIDLVLPQSIVYRNISNIVYIIQTFTQLNPKFLGLVPICVAKGASILVLQYLLYISPVVVWIIVILLVLCSRQCSKYVKFSDRTPITVISLLILLTFTAFTKTSFNIVLPTTFSNVDGTYVNIAPDTEYFASIDHQIFVIIAMTVLLIGVLPFMSFLFMAPFLSRYCNMMRIKPFLDEFQACYKDDYRWMAGFYFLCRISYFLSQLFQQVVVGEYITQFLSLGVLLFHVMLQPYKKKWLNVADTVLLADLLCFSLLYGNTAQTILSENLSTLRDIIAFVLILIPIVQMAVLLLIGIHYRYPILKQCFTCYKEKKQMALRSDSIASVPYREPLLSMDDSFDPVRMTDYETGTLNWNTEETSRGYTVNSTRNTTRNTRAESRGHLPRSTEISLKMLAETDSCDS